MKDSMYSNCCYNPQAEAEKYEALYEYGKRAFNELSGFIFWCCETIQPGYQYFHNNDLKEARKFLARFVLDKTNKASG